MSISSDQLRSLDQLMRLSPHNEFLGLHLTGVEGTVLTAEIEYRDDLVGDPESGVLHGGVVTAMLDAACGLAVMVKLGKLTRIATLDLRIDYLKPTRPRNKLFSRCRCYKLTKQVAFVEGTAYELTETGEQDDVARATGTFILLGARGANS